MLLHATKEAMFSAVVSCNCVLAIWHQWLKLIKIAVVCFRLRFWNYMFSRKRKLMIMMLDEIN